MYNDRSMGSNPNGIKRFNTKEILFHFASLLNPEKFKNLDGHAKALLAEVGNTLAQFRKEIQTPLPNELERTKAHLGKPPKGSKPEEVLMRLVAFENNFLPNLMIQQDERKKEVSTLRTKLEALVAQGGALDVARLEKLKAELEQFKLNKLQAFREQKEELREKFTVIRDDAVKATGKRIANVDTELDEGLFSTAAPAAPTAAATPAAPATPAAAPTTTPTSPK